MEDMLQDQIVVGILDESTRKRMLANPKLTLQKAIEIIQIEEQIELDSRWFHSSMKSPPECMHIGNYQRTKPSNFVQERNNSSKL